MLFLFGVVFGLEVDVFIVNLLLGCDALELLVAAVCARGVGIYVFVCTSNLGVVDFFDARLEMGECLWECFVMLVIVFGEESFGGLFVFCVEGFGGLFALGGEGLGGLFVCGGEGFGGLSALGGEGFG